MPVGSSCSTDEPAPPAEGDAPRPTVTPGMVLRQVKTIGLPSLTIRIQPADATLVNFDTIFYAEEPAFEHSIDLLGYDVDITADPTQYVWHTGDGTTLTTGGPGAPYPDKDIVHRYTDAHVTVRPSVDVTYEVEFRVDGGAWRTLDQTLTADGEATALQIKEAAPVLVK